MTKQEEIRKVIDTYTDDACLYPESSCAFDRGGYCVSDDESYKCLMKRLDELGVVIQVERELPKLYDDEHPNGFSLPGWCTDAYKKAGYVAWEPLIGEK